MTIFGHPSRQAIAIPWKRGFTMRGEISILLNTRMRKEMFVDPDNDNYTLTAFATANELSINRG